MCFPTSAGSTSRTSTKPPPAKWCAEFLRTMKHAPDYCEHCLEYWRENYGEAFVALVAKLREKKP